MFSTERARYRVRMRWAAPAGHDRDAADRAGEDPAEDGPVAGDAHQVPSRKRKDRQVGQLLAGAQSLEPLPRGQVHDRLLRFTVDDEVGVASKQMGKLGGGEPDEPGTKPSVPFASRPV